MIQYLYELPTVYHDYQILEATRTFHNFSSQYGRYYELVLGRNIMVDPLWRKYKIAYMFNGINYELVFMTRYKMDIRSLLDPYGRPVTMYPIWCKQFAIPGTGVNIAKSFIFVDSINEILTTSDIIPDTEKEFFGVQSLSRFLREVLIRAYGSGHGIYVPDIAYGMAQADAVDIASTLSTVLETGCDSLTLDYEVYEIIMGDHFGPKEDWIKMIGVYWSELDPLATWFATNKHLSTELRIHMASNCNVDVLPQVAEYLNKRHEERANGVNLITFDGANVEYEASEVDCLISYALTANTTDFKFNTVGNQASGLQDRYVDARNIYKTAMSNIVHDGYSTINDSMIYSLINKSDNLFLPRRLCLEVEKTWTEELWVRNSETGEVHYVDLVWRLLASSVGLVNKFVTNQLI